MVHAVFRLLLSVYFIISLVLLLMAMSNLFFNKADKRLTHFYQPLPIILLWPIALFSIAGREELFKHIIK